MWSVGLILVEFYTGVPILRGKEFMSKSMETNSGLMSQLTTVIKLFGRHILFFLFSYCYF